MEQGICGVRGEGEGLGWMFVELHICRASRFQYHRRGREPRTRRAAERSARITHRDE
jgi:hypothetical protein